MHAAGGARCSSTAPLRNALALRGRRGDHAGEGAGGRRRGRRPGLDRDLYLTIPRGRYNELAPSMDIPPQMIAPLEPHANAGQIRVALDGEVLAERPLLTLSAVEPGSLWRRMVDTVELWFE